MPDARLAARLHDLVQFALARPRGGDASWDQRLHELGLRPLAPQERQLHLQQGPPLTKGPVLLELRHALEAAVRREANPDANPNANPNADSSAARAMAIQDALREFLNAAKPPVTTSSIFANATATTRTYGNTAGGAETVRCATCGAPRMNGQRDMQCGYCGSAMRVTD